MMRDARNMVVCVVSEPVVTFGHHMFGRATPKIATSRVLVLQSIPAAGPACRSSDVLKDHSSTVVMSSISCRRDRVRRAC